MLSGGAGLRAAYSGPVKMGVTAFDETKTGKRCNAVLAAQQWVLRGTGDFWSVRKYFKIVDLMIAVCRAEPKTKRREHQKCVCRP
jgi:hypothetical protein